MNNIMIPNTREEALFMIKRLKPYMVLSNLNPLVHKGDCPFCVYQDCKATSAKKNKKISLKMPTKIKKKKYNK